MSDLPTLNPNTLSEIFAKSGEDLTDEDLNILISRFRAERAQVLADEAAGKSKKKSELSREASSAKKEALKEALAGLNMDFGDL